MKQMLALWRFSRPHTIIGSTVSVTCLFFYAWLSVQKDLYAHQLGEALITLFAALACNLFITGLNQIYDVDIDKENKPKLPLVSGELSMINAKKTVLLSLVVALSLSYYLSFFFGNLILGISTLGWAYSSPPIRFKRYHLWAASAIALVRGPLVNVGIALHFVFLLKGSNPTIKNMLNLVSEFRYGVWIIPLTVFITAFSLGIAWFKDLPDVQGDERHKINTLAVKAGKPLAFMLGVFIVSLAYGFLIWWGFYFGFGLPFVIYHLLALLIFALFAYRVKLNDQGRLKRFYMSYWILFFLEYFSFFLMLFK